MLDIEEQSPADFRCLQSPRYTYTVPNKNEELDALNCLFQGCGAGLMDEESFFSHIESHLDLLPSATNGSSELIREELCSLQKAIHYVEEIMLQYKKDGCKDRNAVEDLLRQLHLALNELKESAEKHGPSNGCTPHCTGYDEGTQTEIRRPLSYESLQSLRRGIAKAVERAKLKIDNPTRCHLKWHTLAKYSPNASHTQPGLGKGAQTAAHSESFFKCCEHSSGRSLGVVEVSCLILGKTMCPPLQWLYLQSLQLEPPSTLDQSFIDLIPALSKIVTTLSRHHTIALSMSLASTSLTVLAFFIPLSHISESCRSPVLFCCWLALVASGPLWTYLGGSAANFFLIFMPYAMSVGISIGILWHRCITKREYRVRMTQEELQRKASLSEIADTQ